MKKTIYTICTAFVLIIVGTSAINSPKKETHSTGYFSATAQSCSCHGVTAVTSNNISVTGIPDTVYTGSSDTFSLTITNATAKRFGFALSATKTGGSFTTTNPYAQVSTTATYEMTHKSPPAATGSYTYNKLTWKAPSTPGTVKFAFVGMCGANTSGSTAVAAYKNTKSFVVIANTVPVKLTSFDALQSNGKVNLAWTSASEVNLAYYAIQRSADGVNYTTVGKLTAAGNTASIHTYDYTDDATKLGGAIYYRLNSVDKDGKSAYSAVKQVVIKTKTNILTGLYPNPLRLGQGLKLNYTSVKSGTASVQIINMTGKKVLNTNVSVSEGSNALSVAVGNLPTGIYSVSIIAEDGTVQRQQLSIQ